MAIYKGTELVSGRGGRPGPPGMNSSGGTDMGSKIIPIAPASWVYNGEEYIRVITKAEHGMAESPALLAFTAEYNEGYTELTRIEGFQSASLDGIITLRSGYAWQGVCIVAGGISQALDAIAREQIETESQRALGAESALQASIQAEIDRATQAEAQVLADSKEYTDDTVDSVVTAAVQAENDRATQAETALQTVINNETSRATAAEAQVLADSKDYTDSKIADTVASTQVWLPAVANYSELPNITDTSKTYLCRVTSTNNVYQCVAGQTAWAVYSQNTDYVDEVELASAIQVETNRAVQAEAGLQTAINNEVSRATTAEAQALADSKTYTDNQLGTVVPAAVQTEKDRAMQAESALQTAISNEVTRATQAEAQVLADSKEYTDSQLAENIPPLYNNTGQMTDGAMTQKAVTDALDTITAGASVPYIATVTWSGTLNNYSYYLPASEHGKGVLPLIVTLLYNSTIDCSPFIDSAGNITLHSNANLSNVILEVR